MYTPHTTHCIPDHLPNLLCCVLHAIVERYIHVEGTVLCYMWYISTSIHYMLYMYHMYICTYMWCTYTVYYLLTCSFFVFLAGNGVIFLLKAICPYCLNA